MRSDLQVMEMQCQWAAGCPPTSACCGAVTKTRSSVAGCRPSMSARCPYPGVRVVYVREMKGLDSPVLLWHVCLAKDKFLSENLPKQLSSAASFLCVENSPPPCSCFLWPSKWSSLEKEDSVWAGSWNVEITWWLPLFDTCMGSCIEHCEVVWENT